jgi:hypothetical protein
MLNNALKITRLARNPGEMVLTLKMRKLVLKIKEHFS